ncbi:MAG: hypothetical protein L0Y76_11790 [Ignavibacteria bacterium]|nr:hypothetical protein [Ignavibacteria bacterium]
MNIPATSTAFINHLMFLPFNQLKGESAKFPAVYKARISSSFEKFE